MPNGLCFSPDEKILYVNDTRMANIRAFDVAPDGSVSNGRLFHKLTGSEARQMLKLYEAVDDHDDVQHVWANFDIEEKEIEASLA